MDTLKMVIAQNITELRKSQNLTQAELATLLNYSDKSISKWERGESLPDIGVLKRIADIFEVTVDDLLHENVSLSQEKLSRERERRRNQILISGLAILAVWIVVTVVYIYGMVYVRGINLWTLFVWAVPLSAAVSLYCNRLWGNRRIKFWILSVLTWSLLAALFAQTLEYMQTLSPWPLFFAGIPIQVALILWDKLTVEADGKWLPRKPKKQKKE